MDCPQQKPTLTWPSQHVHPHAVTPRLPVANLDRTIAFYRDVLAFELEVSWPEVRPTFALLGRGGVRLGFFEPTEHQPGPVGYAELVLHVADAEGVHALVAQRVPIEWGPEVYSYGCREFAFRDPDQYLLIVSEETDATPTTGEPG